MMKTIGDPETQVKVYDNNGRTYDRYSVIIGENIFTMSPNALSPQGVNMFARTVEEDEDDFSYLGKRKTFREIPDEVRQAIMKRLKE
jgi:hypothetical protein